MKLPLCLLFSVTWLISISEGYIDVGITVSNTSLIGFIDYLFVGVTIDAHLLPTPRAFGGLNLSSEKVRVLAKGLTPSYLRIGGTFQDNLTFVPSGDGGLDANNTFTGATWDAINEFVQNVEWNFIFGLNALKRKGGRWDPTNALELLRYSADKKYFITGFELGNEPDIFPSKYNTTVTGTELGREFQDFKEVLKNLPPFQLPLVIGPDMASVTGTARSQFFADFFTGGGDKAVDRITFHQYYTNGHTATIDQFTDPELMDHLIYVIETAQNVSRRTNPTTPLWLGETSSCYDGGAPGISDTYVAGFLWLDKLGIAARMGLQAVLRQDFYGGSYSLIETNTFDPLPDYWLTLLYKNLVGCPVLQAHSNSKYVRTYAHCTRDGNVYGYTHGSVVIYLLVISDDMVKVTFPEFKNQKVDVFWLEPVGGLTSQSVALNGLPLELTDNKLPKLPQVSTTSEDLYLPGKTFGFLVFPDANFSICKTASTHKG